LKIAFWSNAKKACGVSSNLAAISVATVTRYPYSAVTLENHLCQNNLGKAFLGTSQATMIYEVGANYYDGGGIEGLLRRIYRDDYDVDILKSYLKEVINQHLYYIPQSRVLHNDIFNYEFHHSNESLFELLNDFADISFIDTASHNNLSSNTILEEADLIVVNLCQNERILEDFFLNYQSLIEKSIFIIGNYSSHSMMSCKRISKIYDIPWENIVAIPTNEFFHNAFHHGRVVEFITGNYMCGRESPNYLFIQSVKKATHIIIKKAEYRNKCKEMEFTLC
jgi:hypothetical protein